MHDVLLAEPTETPRMLSPIATYYVQWTNDGNSWLRDWFYVTHFHYRHMQIVRRLYAMGYQIAFPYY